jgi:hypothetical protein
MKIPIAMTAAAAGTLVAASMLGVASAEAPTAPPVRTIAVEGVAIVPIAQGADAATATAAYRQGMTAAVADGQSKAEFLAGKVGATLGAAQSVVERGGYISCTGLEEQGYVEYQGAQPDFGSPGESGSFAARGVYGAAAKPQVALPSRPGGKRRKHKKTTAVKAAAGTCTLSTGVNQTYAVS